MLTTLVVSAVAALTASDIVRVGREKFCKRTSKPNFSKSELKAIEERGLTKENDVSKRLPITRKMMEVHSYDRSSLVPTYYTENQTSVYLDYGVIEKINKCNSIQVTPEIIKYMTNRMDKVRRKTFVKELESISKKALEQYSRKTGFTDIHAVAYHLPFDFEKNPNFKDLKVSYFDIDFEFGFFYHVAIRRLSEKTPINKEFKATEMAAGFNRHEVDPNARFHNSLSRYPDITNMPMFNNSCVQFEVSNEPLKNEEKVKEKVGKSLFCF